MKPTLTFFCELSPEPLADLFADGRVIAHLRELEARVSLGILDLSAERAAVVRLLNNAGIPVIAWQLLPRDQGYWYNLDNAPQAAARYIDFKAWTAEHDLHWAGVGVDIEPDIRETGFLRPSRWGALFRGGDRLETARARYTDLLAQMRADGYPVDSYIMFYMIDERQARSTLFQRLMGLIDLKADHEIPMLYTSFMGRYGPALLWSYARDVKAAAVGSTGGGVEIEGVVPGDRNVLDWRALERDLLLAGRWLTDIYIFSLEGCVRQGLLERLITFEWLRPAAPSARRLRRVYAMRWLLHKILRISALPGRVVRIVRLTWVRRRVSAFLR